MNNNKLVVELRGVEFVNKGAELMLYAILKKVREWNEDVQFVMESTPRVPSDRLKSEGILSKAKYRKFKIEFTPLLNLLPAAFLQKRGYVKESEIGVVLEASGFAFGDQWGAAYANRRLGSKVKTWKKAGKKIILLPQAFGSFEDKALQKVMQDIISYSDLLFARERQSMAYLQGVSKSEKISSSPDFTNLLKGTIPKDFNPQVSEVAVIPNYKMVQGNVTLAEYGDFLVHAINTVRQHNKNPYFLIHEGKRDLEIGKYVNEKLDQPLQLIKYENALDIKGVISTASFVICSRFHGVVSALSQGVPCVTTSWSHKYEMLVEEYESKDTLIKDLKEYGKVDTLIAEFSNEEKKKKLSEKLIMNANKQKQASELMWDKVFSLISKGK